MRKDSENNTKHIFFVYMLLKRYVIMSVHGKSLIKKDPSS